MNAHAPALAPVAVVMDTTRAERERLIAYAYSARLTIDEVTYQATMAMVDGAVETARRTRNLIPGVPIRPSTSASPCSPLHSLTAPQPGEKDNRNRTPSRAAEAASSLSRLSGGKGVNEDRRGGGSLPGSLTGDAALLELLVHTLREALRVDRGEVLTDAVIERRARNGVAALASVIDEVLDESAPV